MSAIQSSGSARSRVLACSPPSEESLAPLLREPGMSVHNFLLAFNHDDDDIGTSCAVMN